MQELAALVQYIKKNKEDDLDWFTIKPKDKDGVQWSGTCWSVHEMVKYEMPFEFELPAAYPTTAPEIKIPTLLGKTAKMYRVRDVQLAAAM
jgi:ufm1-conjugating enzyme 1